MATDAKSSVQCATFTPDGRQLLTLNRNREVVTLDVATGNKVSSFTTSAAKSAQAFDYMITLCPDGSKLAISSESERGVDIWDIKSGTRLYSLPEEDGTVYWLAWSADSRRLAVSRDNGKIAIWNPRGWLDLVGLALTGFDRACRTGRRGGQNEWTTLLATVRQGHQAPISDWVFHSYNFLLSQCFISYAWNPRGGGRTITVLPQLKLF